jgi:hypothetical protein
MERRRGRGCWTLSLQHFLIVVRGEQTVVVPVLVNATRFGYKLSVVGVCLREDPCHSRAVTQMVDTNVQLLLRLQLGQHSTSPGTTSEHAMADIDVFAAMGISGFGKADKKRELDPSRFDKTKREDVTVSSYTLTFEPRVKQPCATFR